MTDQDRCQTWHNPGILQIRHISTDLLANLLTNADSINHFGRHCG
jgi:hypothetical protein